MSRNGRNSQLVNKPEDPHPLITIGLTCYNAEGTILRALQSAFEQDWPDFEVIVVDDCSSDGSVAAIKKAIAGRDNAKLIQQAINGGPAQARNSILAAAKGVFVAFFDDDDISFPSRLRRQYERITDFEDEKDSKKIFCYASGRRRYSNGYELISSAIGSQEKVPHGTEVADYLLFNKRNPGVFYGAGVPTCALMARTETILAIGAFDPGLRRVEDVDLAIRLALSDGWFVGTAEELYLQFASMGLDKAPNRNLESELALTDKYADYLRSSGSLRYAQDWFKIRYYHFSGQRGKFALALLWFLARFPLRGGRHLLRSAPARAAHERKMREPKSRIDVSARYKDEDVS